MSDNELTDKERELLAQARQRDDPTVVEAEEAEQVADAEALLSAAEGIDSPMVVDEETYENQQEHQRHLEDQMTDALVEREGYQPSEVLKMGYEEKAEVFEDEDGNFQAEALVQNPETGGTTPDEETDSDGTGDLDDEALEQAREIKTRIEHWDGKNDTIVEAEQEALADLVGADSFDDVDMEAL